MAQELPGGDGDVCHICLEAVGEASPPPMQSGCACRGEASLPPRPELRGIVRSHAKEGGGGGVCDPRVFCASKNPSFLAKWRVRGRPRSRPAAGRSPGAARPPALRGGSNAQARLRKLVSVPVRVLFPVR